MDDVIKELMARVTTAPSESAGKLIVAYSQPGAGKTSTFCQAPGTLLIECKDYSSDSLKQTGAISADLPVIKARNYDDTVGIITDLSRGGHGFRKIVIDGPSGLSDWLDQDILRDNFKGDAAKFVDFGRGASAAAIRWQEFANAVIDLVASGPWVFLLCHKAVVTEKNPQGSDYLRSTLGLHKDKLAPFVRYVDAVLFMDFIIGETSVNQLTKTAKVVGGEKRVMYTQPSASYEAKNRLNLPQMIDLGSSPAEAFKAFSDAIKAGKKKA